MLEGVLVKQVGFIEEKDGMDALLNVTGDGIEEAASGGGGRKAEGDAELAIEGSAAEGGVVAVGQTKACGGMRWRRGAQHAGPTDARLADEDEGGARGQRVEEAVNDDLLRGGEPEVSIGIALEKGGSRRPKAARYEAVVVRAPRGDGAADGGPLG